MLVHVHNKTTVNLDHVGANFLEVGKRGVARAKIIQRHPRANAAHLVDKFACVINVVERHALGNFKAHHVHDMAVVFKQLIHLGEKLRVIERRPAEVDAREMRLG